MDFKGRYEIAGSAKAIWEALHDPEVLKACIPGADVVERVSPTAYTARVALKIGPLQARFDGNVEWLDETPPDGAAFAGTLKGSGQGGPAGFARGEALVVLREEADKAVLTYEAKATVGGKLAQVGQRLIDGAAKSTADAFFTNFCRRMAEADAAAASDAARPEPAQAVAALSTVPRWVWGLVGVAVVAGLGLLLIR